MTSAYAIPDWQFWAAAAFAVIGFLSTLVLLGALILMTIADVRSDTRHRREMHASDQRRDRGEWSDTTHGGTVVHLFDQHPEAS